MNILPIGMDGLEPINPKKKKKIHIHTDPKKHFEKP